MPPRRRRRSGDDAGAPAKRARAGGDDDGADGPLRGVLFSVSVDAARSDAGDGAPTFAAVHKRAAALGGAYSATVHRRVGLLLATPHAVDRRTQRVRKAARLGVAVVDADAYLDACGDGARPPSTAFELAVPPPECVVADADRRPPPDADAGWAGAARYDGGCCCACHDRGAASCDWCVDLHASPPPPPA